METDQSEEKLLRSVALQNARSIQLARDNSERELLQTQEALRASKEQTTAINEALLISGLHQHELTEAAEKLSAQLQAEIAVRTQADEALRESEDRYRVLYAALPVAAFVCDRNAVIQNYNRRAVELWGREPKIGVEQHCGSMKLILPDGSVLPHAQSPMMEVLRTGTACRNVEVFIERPDGSRVPVIVNFCALKDAQGEIVGAVTSFDDITERKQAEEKLRESELETQRARDYAQATLRTAPIPLLVLKDDLRVNTANEAFYQNFQVARAETEGALIYDLGNRQWNIPKLRELLEDVLPKNNFFNNFEITHEFETIGRRTMLLNARRMENEAGQPRRIVLAIEDITARKQGEEALRQRTAQFEALLNEAPVGVYVVDRDFRIQQVNPTALPIFGDIPNLIGRDFDEVIHILWPKADGDEIVQRFRHTLETGEPYAVPEFIEERLDSGVREFYAWQINRIPLSEGYGVVCYFRDISAQVLTRLKIQESAERLRFMAESMPQKIFTAKPNGDLDYFNGQWIEFTGLSFDQIRDWGWLQFVHPEDVEENTRRWQHSIDTQEPFYMEHRFLRIDGQYRWHVSRAVPMLDAEGKTLMWIGSNTDIEEVRQAKDQAERASRAKDEFLATLSHELRTPLTPVLMSAVALQRDDRLPQDVRDQLVMMERNVGLEARLIDDMLDLSRIAHGKLLLRTQPCDAHTLVALAIEMVRSDAQRKRQTMEIDLAAQRSHLIGDPARLQQVFWNMLKNAVKFTPECGRLSVRSRDVADGLALEISDSGIGISPESIQRIFLPFEQSAVPADHRIGGLGLGLSIARAILDLHGGSIHAESGGLGQGATFRVELPATEPPLGAAPGSIAQSSGDANAESRGHRAATAPLSLLLVDDHQSTLEVLERLLTRAGHRVTTAISVAGALELAGANRFDIVISDLGLPDGTGFELMDRLRTAHGLRGIALSGYGMDEDLRHSHEAGFAAHLTKPIDFAQLERALADLVADRSA